jgi:hypothetical protein
VTEVGRKSNTGFRVCGTRPQPENAAAGGLAAAEEGYDLLNK